MKFRFLATISLLSVLCSCAEEYDVVVVGGGTGGVAAAIQAGRQGANTVVLGEHEWLGGMLTSAGVSAVDGNYNIRGGIFAEFCDSLANHYGGYEKLKTGWVSNIMFEPHVGAGIFDSMTSNTPNLKVEKNAVFASVEKTKRGWKIFYNQGGKKKRVCGKVVIDATELGDAARAAGVPYCIGMDDRKLTGENGAAEEANDIIQDLTYVAILKDYGKDADMTISKPDGYDPSRYYDCCESKWSSDKPVKGQALWSKERMITYGELPGGKYMLNWPIEGNDFYLNVIDSSYCAREKAYESAKNQTLGFIYYIQAELGMKNLGIADDEFPTGDGLALIPYNRESRRIKAKTLFTVPAAEKPYGYKSPLYRTGIAVGDYAVDHHHFRHPDWDRLPRLLFAKIQAFSVPLGCLIPDELDDFIVAEKSIGVSNLINGTTRLQPVVMETGQAAGELAALAVRKSCRVSEVKIRDVQRGLLESGCYIMPNRDVPVSDPAFKPLQRIAATGILRGSGIYADWQNKSLMRVDDPLRWNELYLTDFYGIPYNQSESEVMASDFYGLIESICGRDMSFDWPDHVITRKEAALTIDSCLDPFNSFDVDYQGNISARTSQRTDFTSYVKTSIGTGGHGHVFVGANTPFGAVQLGPTSVPQTWDWCSGYHISDSTVIGFSHTHLSGTGIGDLFDVTLLPVNSRPSSYTREGIADKADRASEVSVPGYYSVPLLGSGVLCEMTATDRVGFHRYSFKPGGSAIVFDLENGGCWDFDKTPDVEFTVIDSVHVVGHRFSSGWAKNQKLWFSAEFSVPFKAEKVAPMHWYLDFNGAGQVMAKVALSPVSVEGATKNLHSEIPDWDFEGVRAAAKAAWNRELGKIKIDTDDQQLRTIFYTALYHTMIAPSLFCDHGEPRRYTTFSLWDTYRAAQPLYTILHPERVNDVVNSFLEAYDKQRDLPVWHLMGCETDCMVGNPGVSVVADAILKGFNGFDVAKAFEAMEKTVNTADRGNDFRLKYGYIPFDKYNMSVATDMEYDIAEWALAQAAYKLGKKEKGDYYLDRSHSYRNYFDPTTGFMRGKDSKGDFRKDFDPYLSDHFDHDYTEGNAWQYIWLCPHDFDGLTQCFKTVTYVDESRNPTGREALIQKLDSLFSVSSVVTGENVSPDVSGLIGQYAHGNEPSHHVVYFYSLAGEPHKASDMLRRIYKEMYTTQPDGLCGNEDVGQMSAWYILSTLGLYQIEPAGGRFYFGSPLFKSAEINVGGGRKFTVVAQNNSNVNRYIQSVELNGRPYTKNYVDYKDIMAGGTLRFIMGPE